MALRTHLKEEYDKQNDYYYNQEIEYNDLKKELAKKEMSMLNPDKED